MKARYLFPLPQRKPCADIGNKAESLNQLLLDGYPVPDTWICCKAAFQDYQQAGDSLIEELRSELETFFDPGKLYAVRSSASLEDQPDSSYAGQFMTLLDVRGIDNILAAITQVWESASAPGIEAYQEAHQARTHDLHMSVLIQEMVQPLISGVAFSVNPITGMNETIIEAVRGSGEALVQEGVTPWRWVRKWGSWLEEPEDAEIGRQLIEEVSRLTERISSDKDRPVDLEWVYDGSSLYLVQVRDVTALDIPLYSNHISREVFPGLIKPLVWSVNVPLVNGAWVRLLTELIGPNDIQPDSLARSFFYRAYFNMGTIGRVMEMMGFPRQTLELLMGLELEGSEKPSFKPGPGTYALFPRMVGFALAKIGFGRRTARRAAQDLVHYRTVRDQDLTEWTEIQILEHIEAHFQNVQETAYYNVVTPLMMQLFNLLFDRQLKKRGIDPRSISFRSDSTEREGYDPYSHIQDLSALYQDLEEGVRARLDRDGWNILVDLPNAQEFRAAFDDFLDRFGHLSDSGNDFSHVPWRENPDLVLEMVRHHDWSERKDPGVKFSELEIPFLQRLRLTSSYHRALRFQLLREQIGTAYTLGYGLFRIAFRELGKRFESRDLLSRVDDVMFLEWKEIQEMVRGGEQPVDYRSLVAQRKEELERSRDIQAPAIIYGENPVLPANETPDALVGTPTSRGSYTGPACIVRGLEDMSLVQEGDVLVVPYSDVSWTPLFAKAGAVVAEAGGILSHSSIIAREYGIPAVVAVPGATLIPSRSLVTVDGNNGQVIVQGPDGEEKPGGPEP